jgi:hypothetical protein
MASPRTVDSRGYANNAPRTGQCEAAVSIQEKSNDAQRGKRAANGDRNDKIIITIVLQFCECCVKLVVEVDFAVFVGRRFYENNGPNNVSPACIVPGASPLKRPIAPVQ